MSSSSRRQGGHGECDAGICIPRRGRQRWCRWGLFAVFGVVEGEREDSPAVGFAACLGGGFAVLVDLPSDRGVKFSIVVSQVLCREGGGGIL